jgi:hypothetical protein
MRIWKYVQTYQALPDILSTLKSWGWTQAYCVPRATLRGERKHLPSMNLKTEK